MAVKDDGEIYPSEAIVASKARKHYLVPVRSQHWQLRSLISAEKQHIIYFPGGHDCHQIQRLNTLTHECETIRLLTFAPRCLVAENGWLCCGSENGEFVAFRLDDTNESTTNINLTSALGLDPDARLPLGLGATPQREDSLLSLIAQARRPSTNKSTVAKSVKLAKERVNCVTLWFPPTDGSNDGDSYKEPVAVLANNDRTVTLVGLRDFEQKENVEPLDSVPYPDFVNRAIISPDGSLLIAILDDPYLYVHQRVEVSSESASKYRWELKQSHLLKSQRKDDKTDSRGSFAACFSATGKYLAVGTQHGTISIFDTAFLTHSTINPLVTTFTSSRPEVGAGAVRDMAFCPGSYDILAWTEDKGHIGVADLRSNFMVRQIIDINVEADFEHINIFDRSSIDPRLLENRASRRDNAQSTIASSTLGGVDLVNYPLTANEMRVLEAIQVNRRRREQASQQSTEEGSRRLPDGLSWFQSLSNEGDSTRPRERSGSVSRQMSDYMGAYRDQRERAQERAQERLRNTRQLLREGSDRQTGTTRRFEQRWMNRINEDVAALRDQRDRQDTSYLNVLEILRSRELPTVDGEIDETSLLVPLVNQVVNRWEESAIRGTLPSDLGVFEVPPTSDNTAGLAWSQDGRTLFVGAQNGIYELKVNVHNRKFCPVIRMR